jgi:hypothetical protein
MSEITVHFYPDGAREISKPKPEDWDNWDDTKRCAFLDEMKQWLIDNSLAFEIDGVGDWEEPWP